MVGRASRLCTPSVLLCCSSSVVASSLSRPNPVAGTPRSAPRPAAALASRRGSARMRGPPAGTKKNDKMWARKVGPENGLSDQNVGLEPTFWAQKLCPFSGQIYEPARVKMWPARRLSSWCQCRSASGVALLLLPFAQLEGSFALTPQHEPEASLRDVCERQAVPIG